MRHRTLAAALLALATTAAGPSAAHALIYSGDAYDNEMGISTQANSVVVLIGANDYGFADAASSGVTPAPSR